ncbi:inositol monophosphatase family protein [Halomicrobium salinisoli]|uniref:inositol monophosphatase family protein n=1 Tax=Halomicrobium salinisoli TaxID=2878391 RepID=UPI001CEFE87D|nr:inositol monophosphatase family protein [Halomicrobium salinisoli]
MTDDLAAVAGDAVQAGGALLRDRFDAALEADYGVDDVKTAADRDAEGRVLDAIREAYPDHPISAEESGEHAGDGTYRWVVDALDGTNNFASGIPTFGVAATAVEREAGDPVATAVHVPVLDDLYVAARGGGVARNGDPVRATDGDTPPVERATVGITVGLDAVRDEALSARYDALFDAVDAEVKRAIEAWAPVVYWALLARGRLDGFVAFHPDEREQVAGDLLAREAGAAERRDGPLVVVAADEASADALFTVASDALESA